MDSRIVWFIIIIALLVTTGLVLNSQPTTIRIPINSVASPSPTPTATTIVHEGNTYAYGLINTQGKSISLVPNFESKLTSAEFISQYACPEATNGGFYDTNGKAIGLFISDGLQLSGARSNATLNGFLWQGSPGSIHITSTAPAKSGDWALQTGPILIDNGIPRILKLQRDEPARRMIAAITDDEHLLFLTLYNADQVYAGPMLTDLPEILASIAKQERISLDGAINLDGGSASMFSNKSVTLAELTTVGSIFCIR